jgi:hypothetical protein
MQRENTGMAPALAATTHERNHRDDTQEPPALLTSLTAASSTSQPSLRQHGGLTLLESMGSQMGGTLRPAIGNRITEHAAHGHLGQTKRYRNSSWRPTIAAEFTLDTPAAVGTPADATGEAEAQPAAVHGHPAVRCCAGSSLVASPGPEALATSSENQDSRDHFELLIDAMDRCDKLRQEIDSATSQASAFTSMLALPSAMMPGPWRSSLCYHFKAAHNLRRQKHGLLECEYKNLQTELEALRADGKELGAFATERLESICIWSACWTDILRSEVRQGESAAAAVAAAPQTAGPIQSMRSRFVGVSWYKASCKWEVYITHERRQMHL